jgi:hypothetical protein
VTRTTKLEPGNRVRVVQTIRRREGQWDTEIEGEVVKHEVRKTGSWFAHGYRDKLWLNRLTLRKDDGELVMLCLDEHSRVVVKDAAHCTTAS